MPGYVRRWCTKKDDKPTIPKTEEREQTTTTLYLLHREVDREITNSGLL